MLGVLLSLLVFGFTKLSSGFVIAPPWANQNANPCSQSSWQLVYWPATKNCYQIFSRGPCPETQELGFNPNNKKPECRCPQNLPLHWPATDRCYAEHSRGPCEVNQYLVTAESSSPACVSTERCEPGMAFWPPDKNCYELYTQGPCHKGDLLIVNPLTAEPYCGCDPLLLKQYYYPPLKLCYEHYTKGPCEFGSLFSYNHTSDSTDCVCEQQLPAYFKPLGQCFEIGTKGPCGKGQVYKFDPESRRSGCQCKEKYVYWEKTHACYREYTPGPCRPGQFLVKGNDGIGFCSKNPCSKAHLYFPSKEDPSQGHCHKVGGQGPCPSGELVVFEAYSGKSYRGDCGCSSGYNQNFWPQDGKCYEWYSQGPCPHSFLFKYNKEERKTECVCDTGAGFVFWNETSRCYRVYTQGPCPNNAWLIPTGDLSEVYCECRNGYHFAPKEYVCKRTQLLELSRHLPFLKNHRFGNTWASAGLAKAFTEHEAFSETSEEKGKAWGEKTAVGKSRNQGNRGWEEDSAPSHTGFARFITDKKEEPDLEFFWNPSLGKWSDREGRVMTRQRNGHTPPHD